MNFSHPFSSPSSSASSAQRQAGADGQQQRRASRRRVIGYLRANYNKPIQSPDLAAHFHFNPSYLNRVFKAHTGFTIRTFLIDYRINLAMELLRSRTLTVSEVAAAVGFGDIPHFIKTFKKLVGQTPTEYRALFV